jgi:hypothetical protein
MVPRRLSGRVNARDGEKLGSLQESIFDRNANDHAMKRSRRSVAGMMPCHSMKTGRKFTTQKVLTTKVQRYHTRKGDETTGTIDIQLQTNDSGRRQTLGSV